MCIRDSTYIDATEGGAKIAHTEIMPLQEAIATYISDAEPIEENPFHIQIDPAESVIRAQRMHDFLAETVRAVNDHAARSTKAIELLEDALLSLNGSRYVDSPKLIKATFQELKEVEVIPEDDVIHVAVLEAIILPLSLRLNRKMSLLSDTEISVQDAINQMLFAVEYYKGHEQAAQTFSDLADEVLKGAQEAEAEESAGNE